ncbi:hypothetical protein JTB14_030695 [Gonioctena quinquepunctata]|nr:hypothetical protein JTB14_030695 [Gonioctena quinquepunctata]
MFGHTVFNNQRKSSISGITIWSNVCNSVLCLLVFGRFGKTAQSNVFHYFCGVKFSCSSKTHVGSKGKLFGTELVTDTCSFSPFRPFTGVLEALWMATTPKNCSCISVFC